MDLAVDLAHCPSAQSHLAPQIVRGPKSADFVAKIGQKATFPQSRSQSIFEVC